MSRAEHERVGETATHVRLSVLALDDDGDFRQFIREALEHDGHDARVAATPEECLAMCRERLPDVLLLDMKMGASSGEETLAEVRRRWPRLCVIVVTGYPSMETMRRTFKQDVYDYIAKPFSWDEMRAALASAATRLRLGGTPLERMRGELGRQVRLARTARGWTLKELSDACGMSLSQISSIERGTNLPSLDALVSIAEAMEVKPSEWLLRAGF